MDTPHSQNSHFQQEYSFEKRLEVASKILLKYPDRVPVIVEKQDNDTLTPVIDKKKFLVPKDINVSMFIAEIRKHLPGLPPNEGIFIFTNNLLVAANDILGTLYEKNKDTDGFLYVTYKLDNIFG